MEVPEEADYFSMRASVITNQPTFTTNIYSIYDDLIDNYDENYINEVLYKDIIDFPLEKLSELAELFLKEEKIQRAVLLFIYGHNAALEMRLPNYFVAIEALTSYISKSYKEKGERINPIKDSKIASDIKSKINDLLVSYKSKNKLTVEDFNINILSKKINSLDNPPNADKMSESFSLLGYELTKEQKKI